MAAALRGRTETGSVIVDGVAVHYRRLPGEGPPAVFVHGVPTHSEDWGPVLERMGGPAIALDLPGFGRSERPPPERFSASIEAYDDLFRGFLEAMEIGAYSLAVHDWGGVGLIAAQRDPDRLERLVVVNAVPLLPGYRWHRTARIWRTPMLGELSTRIWSRRAVAAALRESRGDWSRPPREFVDLVWDHLGAGTFRSILALYRSAPPARLAEAGRRLGAIRCPALVVWGMRDRYIPGRFGAAYAEALGGAELLELPRVGHWPWWENATVAGRIAAFLEPAATGST